MTRRVASRRGAGCSDGAPRNYRARLADQMDMLMQTATGTAPIWNIRRNLRTPPDWPAQGYRPARGRQACCDWHARRLCIVRRLPARRRAQAPSRGRKAR
jgi:hypothetical protein